MKRLNVVISQYDNKYQRKEVEVQEFKWDTYCCLQSNWECWETLLEVCPLQTLPSYSERTRTEDGLRKSSNAANNSRQTLKGSFRTLQSVHAYLGQTVLEEASSGLLAVHSPGFHTEVLHVEGHRCKNGLATK